MMADMSAERLLMSAADSMGNRSIGPVAKELRALAERAGVTQDQAAAGLANGSIKSTNKTMMNAIRSAITSAVNYTADALTIPEQYIPPELRGKGRQLADMAGMFSPGADVMDAAQSSGDMMDAARRGDGWGMAGAGAGIAAAGMGMFVPGTAKGYGSAAEEVAGMLKAGKGADITDEMIAKADPAELFDLYAAGKTGMDMPMDEASRMARAQGMGFGPDMYHGSNASFQAFDPTVADATGQKVMAYGDGTYLAKSPRAAERYATRHDGGVMYPVRENMERPWTPDNSVSDLSPNDLKTYMNAENGPESLGYSGSRTVRGDSVVPDPTNIRSRFARFDPRLKHLANLSAAGAGVAGIAGGQSLLDYLTQQEQQMTAEY